MYIQAIGTDSFSVYIPGAELAARRLTPSELTGPEAMELLTSSLGPAVKSALVEVFPGRDELLIFVLGNPGAPKFYAFSSLEDLILAAEVCREEVSFLFYTGDEYILAVLCQDGSCHLLGEFGERIDAPTLYLNHLFEHCRCLSSGSALSTLRRTFLNKE